MIPDSEKLRKYRQDGITCLLFVPKNVLESYRNDEMQEWDIDLKIAHINKEKGIEIAEAEDFRKMVEHINKREAKE